MAVQHVLHMQKALTQMNLQIHHVIDDLTGQTGLAIVDGERDSIQLAKLRHYRIQADEETIRESLVGNWPSEHLFALKQPRQMYGHYQQQIATSSRPPKPMQRLHDGQWDGEIEPHRQTQATGPEKRRKRNGRNIALNRVSIFGRKCTSALVCSKSQDWSTRVYR
jgi:hypothetical protein